MQRLTPATSPLVVVCQYLVCCCTYNCCRYVRRSYAAHQNSWEALILWVAAVLFAKIMGVDEDQMNNTAAVWMTCRVV